MARAELTAITIERFKSYWKRTTLEVAPLTVLLGRNNSGKSTLIQALLLLKQTLEHPRGDVPLYLEGPVDALGLRELTSGWPGEKAFDGPVLELTWESDVDVRSLMEAMIWRPSDEPFRDIEWLKESPRNVRLRTTMRIAYREDGGRIFVAQLHLQSVRVDGSGENRSANPSLSFTRTEADAGGYEVQWKGKRASHESVELTLDHFLPVYRIKPGFYDNWIPTWFEAYQVLYEQPLDALRALLKGFSYLGSMRTLPPSIYRPASVPPAEIGVSGELAAQMLHARRSSVVHYSPPLQIALDGSIKVPETIEARPLVDAVNHVMAELGLSVPVRIEDIQNIGFRLLFGEASLQHVGRGLGYLLPVVQLGLISDPRRFDAELGASTRDEYLKALDAFAHVAMEEPETHLHPKVQTRLAHWFVTLAMSGRRLIVETHSDHLIRRLRGLIARAEEGGALEQWLAKNVVIAEVVQDEHGYSELRCSRLTPE
ncbi:MAG TPA: AAA family ATPase, partial [Haliangium sp.]|nr:AAA family ATPase [Haliangium sp.]